MRLIPIGRTRPAPVPIAKGPDMLEALTPLQLRQLQGLATRYQGPSRGGSVDQRTASHADDLENPHKQSLLDAIRGLDPAARSELTALVWVGTGIYRPSEWPLARRHARVIQSDADIVYLVESGPLDAHIERGLARLADASEPTA